MGLWQSCHPPGEGKQEHVPQTADEVLPSIEGGDRVFYLNMLVLSTPDALVRENVAQKVPHVLGFQRLAGELAVRMLSEDKIASKIAENIPAQVPQKMAEMGLQVQCREVYRKGAFLVLWFKVIHADLSKMMEVKAQEDPKAARVNCMVGSVRGVLDTCGFADTFDRKVDAKVTEVLAEKMPQLLPAKMHEKGIILDCVGKTEEEEYAYLDAALRELGQPKDQWSEWFAGHR